MQDIRDFENAWDYWNSKERKNELVEALIELLSQKKWTSFVTLTFKNETPPDKANSLFFYLVKKMNQEVFGEQARRIVQNAYFSYSKAIEYQRRGVIHFHCIFDRPINYALIHRIWNQYAGFAKTEVVKDRFAVRSYVSKYTVKGGEIDTYFAKKRYMPLVIPAWWLRDLE